MANFKTHFITASVSSGAISSAFLTLDIFNHFQTIVAFLVATLGGILPDIDADNSKPLNLAFTIIAIFISFFTTFIIAKDLSIVEKVLFWFFVYFIVRFMVMRFFQSITTHRGVFHSIPMGILISFIVIYISFYIFKIDSTIAWFYGIFLFYGYILHLFLDEIVSVNLFGISVKKSLGTSLKIFDKKTPILYIFIYVSIIGSYFLLPNYQDFLKTISNLDNFFNIWLPKNNWFENIRIY